MDQDTCRVAAAQVTPCFLDRDGTVEKACRIIRQASDEGARLVVFPEAFVPGYPDWVWAVPPGEGGELDDLYARLLANAVTVPGAAVDALSAAAAEAGCYVVVGVSERNHEASGASLYNTLLYLDDEGRVVGKHRKLVPTGAERTVWGQGDGAGLLVHDTPFGKLGGLICWENYMPLARYALFAQGIQIYAAPTWDQGDRWLASLRHIAWEGGAYVIGCCSPLRRSDLPLELQERYVGQTSAWINEGSSAVVAPDGEILAGPLRREEGILYAEIDVNRTRGVRRMLDVAGHYARPDVFELVVHAEPRSLLRTTDGRPDRHDQLSVA